MTPGGAPVARELLLLGGGHAHLGVLRDLARRGAAPGARVTLVAREAEALYSGMLPGLIAGRFAREDCLLDLPRLARRAGARFILAEACGLDRASGEVVLAGGRPPLRYDLLSLNLGAAPALVPGAAEQALVLRPFDRFMAGWEALLARAAEARRQLRLLVVGGGAAGVEVALALRQRLGGRAELTLACRGEAPLPRQAPAARRAVSAALAEAGIAVVTRADIVRLEKGAAVRADGRVLENDAAVWAAGAAPPAWLAASGLPLCPRGFVAVDATLRSTGDERIFAAGDCATVLAHPRERAGVYAVRQGAPLAANLRRVLEGRTPRPFRPQARHLALIATGAARAVAARGGLAWTGAPALRLKDAIDRRWIAMHRRMRPMAAPASPPAPQDAMRCGGCAAKLPAGVLARVLGRLPRRAGHPDVPLALEAPDDAALLRPPAPGMLLVQTADMFRAMVDDPWLFGRIAANHALGDIAAMGATPRTALALAVLPPAIEEVLEADLLGMLAGAEEVLAAAGARLVGGHSAEGAEAMLGFALTGEVPEGAALRKSGLRPGDALVLTKPLGTGVLLAGAMAGEVGAADWAGALSAMQASSLPPAAALRAHGATACTDVTGFGLLNHLAEMLEASGAGAVLEPGLVPALPGAEEALRRGIASTLHPGNLAAARPRLAEGWEAVAAPRRDLLLDPQTAGGLLAGVPPDRAEACLAHLRAAGCPATRIGTVRAGPAGRIAAGAATQNRTG